jgi:hypothetical protein
MPNKHPGEDAFENYAFDRLSESDSAIFEEHLLACERCQEKFAQVDDYVRLMKVATATYVREKGEPPPRTSGRRRGLHWNVAAAALVLVTCLAGLLTSRSPSGQPAIVALDSYRGEASQAPAGRPLDLKIDLTDVRPAHSYRAEVVDAAGRRIWFGGTPARIANGLAPGTYWVRLSTDNDELLREFGLNCTPR